MSNRRSPTLHRRDALALGLKSLGLLAAGPKLLACGAEPEPSSLLVSNLANVGPLGPPDRNGVRLPAGFSSRILAYSGEPVLGEGSHVWHHAPDGGATFPAPDGEWIYVSNSEIGDGGGGVGALRFNRDGDVIDAYDILRGSNRNCAGGPTPWNTWLSCEETPTGLVYECDPFGREAQLRSALGVFRHEAVCVDPVGGRLYLTEDRDDGRFYRFTPDNGLPDLSSGALEVLQVVGDAPEGDVRWLPLPDPSAATVDTRHQVPESTAFSGGEGIWFHVGVVYFSTKGDNRVWALDVEQQRLTIVYDDDHFSPATLTGVDNITTVRPDRGADVLVTEDAGDMQIVALTSGGVVPLLQVVEQPLSEITGPAFDPSGQRLYFSSQRGELLAGITYEVSGPFLAPV